MSISIAGILLGIINIGIVAVFWLLLGVFIVWIAGMFNLAIPAQMQKLYLLLVLLIVVYMFVALFFGMPTVHILPRVT